MLRVRYFSRVGVRSPRYASTRAGFYCYRDLLQRPTNSQEAIDKARALLKFRDDVLDEVEECCSMARRLDDGLDKRVETSIKNIEREASKLAAHSIISQRDRSDCRENTFILIDKNC